MSGFVPHDPILSDPGGSGLGDPCNVCGRPWPCDMREAQRMVIRECRALLASRSFRPDRRPGDDLVRWVSDFTPNMVLIGYGVKGAVALIETGDGRLLAGTHELTVGWLLGALP